MVHPYKETCEKYQPTEYDKFFMDLEKNFDFQEITGTKPNNMEGLLTGYYEPAIKAYS